MSAISIKRFRSSADTFSLANFETKQHRSAGMSIDDFIIIAEPELNDLILFVYKNKLLARGLMKNRCFALRSFWRESPHFRGAFWKISSYLCFSMINGIVRFLSHTAKTMGTTPLPAYEIAFFQNLLGLLFLLPWIVANGPQSLKSRHPILQTSRVILSALGVVLWYLSLEHLPLDQAVALMFTAPLLTALGAQFFLGERISRRRGLAIFIGLVGGAVTSHYSSLAFSAYLFSSSLFAVLPICAASCFSGATLMVRYLTKDDSSELIVTYLLLFMSPLLFIPTVLFGIWPEGWQLFWLVVMGGLAAAAHLALSKAYASAEVSYLIPYGFTKWFASALIGFAAFNEIPSLWTCIGFCTLMGSIFYLSYGEAVKTKQAVLGHI